MEAVNSRSPRSKTWEVFRYAGVEQASTGSGQADKGAGVAGAFCFGLTAGAASSSTTSSAVDSPRSRPPPPEGSPRSRPEGSPTVLAEAPPTPKAATVPRAKAAECLGKRTLGEEVQAEIQACTAAPFYPPSLAAREAVDVTACQFALIYSACVVPNVVVLAVLSDIGIGLQVYNSVASTQMSQGGDLCVFLAGISVAMLYVGDWLYWKSALRRVLTAMVPIMLVALGSLLKARKYPWAPVLFTLFTIPGMHGVLRRTLCAKSRRHVFYTAVGIVTGMCAIGILVTWVVWIYADNNGWNRDTKDRLVQGSPLLYKYVYPDGELNYTLDCHPEDANLARYSKTERPKITAACSTASSVWVLTWMSPVVAVYCNTIMSVFSILFTSRHRHGDGQSDLIRTLKLFLIMLLSIFAAMYCMLYFVSPTMASTTMPFITACLGVLLVWTFVEVDPDALRNIARESKYVQTFAKMWRSDWVRAIAVGALNVCIPLYLLLNRLTQTVRKRRDTNGDHNGLYTKQFQRLADDMSTWNWASILTKVAFLSELYFTFNVGVSKVTYIFLSWLSELLAPVSFALVVLLVFAIGYSMFLLPPVPGVPVYVFSGIVLADQARRNLGEPGTESGFIQGCIIAAILSFVNKLCACCGQYMIGFFLGKSVKVQQLIKVDSVVTRGIEKILSRKGLDVGKVAVLIGGPDWPVSVTCGILRINIPQMLLGTVPVLVIQLPCVLAGAFISRQGSGGEDSIFPTLANTFVVLSFGGQGLAALVASLAVMNVVQEHEEQLAKPRHEHRHVEELTRMEAHANTVYKDVTKWANLFFIDQAILLFMAGFHLLAEFIFVMRASSCFLPFSVDKRIDQSIEDGGLDGDPLKIIVYPVGHLALGLFFTAVLLHIVHDYNMSRRTNQKLMLEQQAKMDAVAPSGDQE